MRRLGVRRTTVWYRYPEIRPPKHKRYLVTMDRGPNMEVSSPGLGGRVTGIMWYLKNEKVFVGWGGWNTFGDKDVVAWAELPAPLAKPMKPRALRKDKWASEIKCPKEFEELLAELNGS